ncbi:GDP-4-dehydro-6-deoxy-D-mannose reductase [Paenibacillus forsythiae]|uniref:GDP-4-dehydro-6-deoxy-D-mannose reductase n=2 Tax=Paenibacillus forsythiae TaxID=365616 RepID=A0ABU3HC25_9BACL|nr:NAD-dependent epimerase/dehydratase family protein [Paenibacillus forsythiae]MDT3428346.1 GDP-4-dehydro-6-deoxy-D-mannose reductase [Paenibacillus forsythiae]
MTGRKLLITGAAGFTGRHAAAYFAAEGAEVTAVLRTAVPGESREPLFPLNVRTYICDLNDGEAVKKMIKDTAPCEVLHLAGKNSVPESWHSPVQYLETNVMAAVYLLDALRSCTEVRLLVAGSRLKFNPGAGAAPPHPYSLSKTLEELVSLSWGVLFRQQVLIAEPCNLIGPGPSTGFCSLLAGHIARSEQGSVQPPFRLSSRLEQRDFLDVRDAVRAYDCILKRGEPGIVYRIDSGRPRRLGEVAERMLRLTRAAVPVHWGPPPGQGAESAPASDAEPKRADAFTRGAPDSQAEAVYPTVHASVLNWRPEVELERSLADILEYYRSSNQKGASP